MTIENCPGPADLGLDGSGLVAPHRALVNGAWSECLSLYDRGLHYGDGLFETIAWTGGRARAWQRHMRRLERGCECLGLPPPEIGLLAQEARTCAGSERQCVLKLILTRGSGGRGYGAGTSGMNPARIWLCFPWPHYPEARAREGVTVRICSMRLSRQPQLAGLKHLNRLEQVLARMEWQDPAVHEGLMLDTEGWLIEGTMSNLFLLQGGDLLTPDLSQCGVRGVTREWVMAEAAGRGVSIRTMSLRLEDLYAAEHAFLCNSLIGIWPIRYLCADPARELAPSRLAIDLAAALADAD